MPRFFISPEAKGQKELAVTGEDAYHIARSLRMAVGDEIILCDGEGTEYLCRLDSIRDELCLCTPILERRAEAEPPVNVTLFMAYPKGDKMETVTQKAVELGAAEIVPFLSSRCIKRPEGDKAGRQTERLSKIAKEAAKQCGRGRLPKVGATLGFSDMLSSLSSYDLALFCYEDERTVSLKKTLDEAKEVFRIAVIIGSEGGFSPEEAERITAAGAVSVSLGPRILRCETAPDYVLSAISYRFEL